MTDTPKVLAAKADAEQAQGPGQLEAVEHLGRLPSHHAGIGRGLGQLADLGAGEERGGPDLHRDVGDHPVLGHHRRGHLPGEGVQSIVHLSRIGEVVLQRLLAAARARHPRFAVHR